MRAVSFRLRPFHGDLHRPNGENAATRSNARHHLEVPKTETPSREWLAVIFPPAAGAVLLVAGALDAASRPHGWLAFGAALAAGAVPPVLCTIMLARKGRLYLRESDAVERSRDRIRRVSIPIGWLLAGLVPVFLLVGGLFRVAVVVAFGGAVLGLWPGLLANFMRLRREVWTQ